MVGWWQLALVVFALAYPARVEPHDAKMFEVTARRFLFQFSPSPFVVNQGDHVTLIVTAVDAGVGDGHGFFLEHYAPTPRILQEDVPVTIEFIADEPGTFAVICAQFCGTGHGGMDAVFTVVANELEIVSVQPASGPVAGGTLITIEGRGFVEGTTVTVGGADATSVNVVDSDTLTAVTPAHAAGLVDIDVTKPTASATASAAFRYVSPPRRRAVRS